MLYGAISILLLQAQAFPGPVETVEVRSAAAQVTQASVSSVSTLDRDLIERAGPTHPNELFNRVPGAWISRGSGQEHLTALRSPVLTGPGACGAFLLLEDRVPVRPAGFCNVNGLFEVNLLQAERVEVVRGPGTVIYGSNALHGAMDVTSPDPDPDRRIEFGFEAGTDDYYRARLGLSGESLAFHGNYSNSGSFRDDEGFEHTLGNVVWTTRAGVFDVRTRFSYANLDQDTAGFILGQDSYKDPEIRTQNFNPEAFRKANAARLTSRWSRAPSSDAVFEVIPYLRSSDMDFLQHFLPGKPLEHNGQDSAGALFSWHGNNGLVAGLDVEWTDGFLVEYQENPITDGSIFLQETRPQGFHYDYSVTSLMLAAWSQYRKYIENNLILTVGLRAEHLGYDYNNHMLVGNTRDDGTECGFGGCLYTRPADRSDSFTNLAPELGLNWTFSDQQTLFIRLARGFRAPQATELYRLQNGQQVADLETETLDTLEAGIRGSGLDASWEVTAYTMRKRHFIFRDADGFNISDGKTDHAGIEAAIDWQVSQSLALSGNLSWAKHEYAFDRQAALGEKILKGNEVDTAPQWLGALRLMYRHDEHRSVEAEWVHAGNYFLDAANLHSYGGHDILNLRAYVSWPGSAHRLGIRITNLLDDYFAERADFAFGNYRYFPGAGRRLFVEWRYAR